MRRPPDDAAWLAYHVRSARHRARHPDGAALDMAIVRALQSLCAWVES